MRVFIAMFVFCCMAYVVISHTAAAGEERVSILISRASASQQAEQYLKSELAKNPKPTWSDLSEMESRVEEYLVARRVAAYTGRVEAKTVAEEKQEAQVNEQKVISAALNKNISEWNQEEHVLILKKLTMLFMCVTVFVFFFAAAVRKTMSSI